jgi:hypothetical protein
LDHLSKWQGFPRIAGLPFRPTAGIAPFGVPKVMPCLFADTASGNGFAPSAFSTPVLNAVRWARFNLGDGICSGAHSLFYTVTRPA